MIKGYRKGMSAAGTLIMIAGFAACAGVEPTPAEWQDREDGGDVLEVPPTAEVVDGSAPDARESGDDAGDSGDAGVPQCTVDWCETSLPIPDGGKLTLMDVWVSSGPDTWAVSEEGLVLHWNGSSWSVAWDSGTRLYGVWGDHEGTLWAVGAGGAVFRGPQGKNWAPIPSGLTTDLMGICEGSRDAQHVRNISIVGFAGTVLRWTGDTDASGNPIWRTSTFGSTDKLHSVWCSGLDVWVSGTSTARPSGGRIYLNSGDSASWVAQSAATDKENYNDYETFSSVWAHDQANIWARGEIGIVRSAPANGNVTLQWSRERSALYTNAKRPSDIWGTAANDVWIVSSNGRIHHWDGSRLEITITSKSWDVLTSDLHAVSGSGPQNVWVVGDNVALRRNVPDAGQN